MGDFADGYALRALMESSGGGGDDEWTYPASWIPMPEPNEYEIYLLIEVTSQQLSFSINVGYYTNGSINSDIGRLFIDFGDGTTADSTGYDPDYTSGEFWITGHKYEYPGQYLVKVICTEYSSLFYGVSVPRVLAIKAGNRIMLRAGDVSKGETEQGLPIYYMHNMQYLKFNGEYGIRLDDGFGPYLQKIDTILMPTQLENTTAHFLFETPVSSFDFSNFITFEHEIVNTRLRKIIMPNCIELKGGNNRIIKNVTLEIIEMPLITDIPEWFFSENKTLKRFYAPNCTHVGAYAFSGCYSLTDITLAENCEIENTAFNNCPFNQYTRP